MNAKFCKSLATLVIFTVVVISEACAVSGTSSNPDVNNGTPTRTVGDTLDDQSLAHNVNNVLSAQISDGSFTIVSYGSKILLAGHVSRSTDISKAIRGARDTKGVSFVWNYLTVGNSETASDISKDAYLTIAVKTRLIAQKNINTNNIKVVTSNRVVYLLGSNAGSKNQLKDAIEGIRQIAGVNDVVNLIEN